MQVPFSFFVENLIRRVHLEDTQCQIRLNSCFIISENLWHWKAFEITRM
ncbi:hypothetical protein HMPREF1141_2983 [Clostridium sp. MSTE9]|nr:hypothetical protein HMPREF1141_2983 [Clostridium sp. MSTE9]